MANELDPLLEPHPPLSPTHKSTFRDAVYGAIDIESASSSSSPRIDSSIQVTPIELPRPGYSHPHQHRIIPPSIKGHGRLIIAHRTVPYFVGLIFVIGSFTWAVWCALYLYPVLGGHPNDRKPGFGLLL
ncbi:hypothetical protein IQ07DRAFT_582408 [Pyrenochaeta sp. DS3sAY3a]|nr:hypothetical protein IQ07DRAFT_582408 [Pyrenochaeta sp. DS3sAY3a]